MTISASHITDQLMQASDLPPILLSEYNNAKNEPICITVGEWRKDPSTPLRVTWRGREAQRSDLSPKRTHFHRGLPFPKLFFQKTNPFWQGQ